ncbi:glycosyltransferase family 2 protein [Alkalihalobacillus sp. BA299]|uniref:glycosyltransferase family 2 protein n=1 Tax=Alkalihalobacillus sp. BA299 TaxID=2815938 RepID=UPI001AD9AF1C|nr:glycosyltransferase family 2 protein [Alkalihalobacillus sp. BA299]
METTKISIIVPVYKVEKYLHKCIDSILNQSYPNLEIILVNDGSPDNCGSICDEYAEQDQRVKVIHKENGGLSSARNSGLDLATGEYIGFVDSDDYIEKDMYEELYKAAYEHSADVVECSLNIIEGTSNRTIEGHGNMEIGDNVFALQRLLELPYRNVTYNKLYKKTLFNDIRYPNKTYEDGFVAYKILHNLKKYVFIGLGKYNYIKREGSIMADQKKYSIKNLDGLEVQIERYKYFKEHNLNSLILYLSQKHLFVQLMFHFNMLQKNQQLDREYLYRKMIQRVISEYYDDFISNENLSEYKKIIQASKKRFFLFQKNIDCFNMKQRMREIKYKLKISIKRSIIKGT